MLRRVLLLCALGLLDWLAWEAITWPDVAALAHRVPTTTAFIELFKARERADGRRPQVTLAWTDYQHISPNLKRAALVAEDVNFFSHHGFDWGEIKFAVEESLGDRETAVRAPPIAATCR